jgi:dipeptidase E
MRYLLTSGGVRNETIRAALVDLLDKPIGECSALVIPTAAYWFDSGPDIAYSLIADTWGAAMTSLGWRSVGVLELSALPSLPDETWMPRVRETDVLLVGGGDPMYLCRHMRESRFADLMSSLAESTVYVGLSAGSMAVTASFGAEYNDRPVPTEGPETPLGLVDIAIYPHFENPDMDDTRSDAVARWARHVPVPTYALDDDTAIRVVDGALEVVSEGNWELFPA